MSGQTTCSLSNSYNRELIPYNTHVEWFSRIMNDDRVVQHIVMGQDTKHASKVKPEDRASKKLFLLV